MKKNRETKAKIRGTLGFTRVFLFYFSIYTVLCLQLSLITYVELQMSLLLIENMIIALVVTMISCAITFALLYWRYPKYKMNHHRNLVRPITDTEYQTYYTRTLIHYTDYLSSEDYDNYKKTGLVNLIGNASIVSNYAMMPENRAHKYVWFHISKVNDPCEPVFDSFWNSHGGESTPRDFKVTIPFTQLPKEKIMIRPDSKAILIQGDYNGPATITTTFPWYNQKVYWFRTLYVSFNDSICFLYFNWVKIKLELQEKRSINSHTHVDL